MNWLRREELKEEIRLLDELIKESSGLTRCRNVYTCFYGYSMKQLSSGRNNPDEAFRSG